MDTEQRLAALESRVAVLEADREKLLDSLKKAMRKMFENPMTATMVKSMLPKEMQKGVMEFIHS